MTSNLGTEGVRRQPFGFRTESGDQKSEMSALRESVDSALKRDFRPEFLNRIDETIVFHPLNQAQIVQIVELMVQDVQNRLDEREVTFHLTKEAELWLAKEGFDPVYGARPLRRAIQRHLENPFARMILSAEVLPGDHVVVEASPDGLVFSKQDSPGRESGEPVEAAVV